MFRECEVYSSVIADLMREGSVIPAGVSEWLSFLLDIGRGDFCRGSGLDRCVNAL